MEQSKTQVPGRGLLKEEVEGEEATVSITFRLSATDADLIRRLAHRKALNVSNLIRTLTVPHVRQVMAQDPIAVRAIPEAVLTELGSAAEAVLDTFDLDGEWPDGAFEAVGRFEAALRAIQVAQ